MHYYDWLPLAALQFTTPSVSAEGASRVAGQIKDMYDAIPDGLTVMRFMHWDALHKRSLAAELGFHGLRKLEKHNFSHGFICNAAFPVSSFATSCRCATAKNCDSGSIAVSLNL
jgi:hypothetical protein